jgi:hypothetical protein
MVRSGWLSIFGKTFGLALIFNSLLTAAYGFTAYRLFNWFFPYDIEFYTYLFTGHIFLMTAIAGLLNIIPSLMVSRSFSTSRVLFHHYVYGAFVIVGACIYLVLIPFDLLSAFLVYDTRTSVNVARLLILVGITMIVDDLPDVHPAINLAISWIKPKTGSLTRVLLAVHLVAAVITLYVVTLLCLAVWMNPESNNIANGILVINFIITVLIAFIAIKMHAWDKLKRYSKGLT